jgi:hypothetical protein
VSGFGAVIEAEKKSCRVLYRLQRKVASTDALFAELGDVEEKRQKLGVRIVNSESQTAPFPNF